MPGDEPTPFDGADADVTPWLELAVDAAGVGVFDWDLTTGALVWDDRLLALFGRDRASFAGTIEGFTEYVHPDDRDRVSRALAFAVDTVGEYEAEYRITLPGGQDRWIRASGRAFAGPDGTSTRVVGAAIASGTGSDEDTRAFKVLEAMPTAFFALNRDWRFTYVNPTAQRLLGGVSTDPVGHVIWELFPDAVGTEFETSYRRAAETHEPVSFEAYYPPPLDDWYEIRAWPTPDGLSVYFLDITERRATQQALERHARRSSMLAAVTEALTDTMDPEVGVTRLAGLLVPEIADWCIVTIVDGPRGAEVTRRDLRDIGAWHVDPAQESLVEQYAETRLPALRDDAFLFRALQGSEPILIERDATAAISAVLEPGLARDLYQQLAPESAVIMPLRGQGQANGLLTMFRSDQRPPFGPDDLDLLRDVGGRAGMALGNARAFTEQRDLAEALQRSMLTEPPEPDYLHVVVRYEPAADVAQVGGDWYDSFVQPGGSTNVVIGDVVGHDTAAAAAMGQVRSLLRGIAMTTNEGPADVLRRVDDVLAGLQVDTTASVVMARFEQTPAERAEGLTRLRWSNAGHPPPLVAIARDAADLTTDDVEVRELWGTDTNLLLGLFPDTERTEAVITLPLGATVLLYTDGLVERRGEDLDAGISRLASVLAELVAEGVELDGALDEVLERMLPGSPQDDVAIVAVRLHPDASVV
ncbi:SpoIIE family protein phosphatase [Aeromicrobium sp. Leaf350]|uniref:SpoIIE family protein phosphatase n=1 Tax=Aeromicrobium sp. Leaf350 TaxID=2876565 RepID=UPI001E312D18|nr:SpoIIE family protein phosphatase [Aeromicrobium sp. Leaf350]